MELAGIIAGLLIVTGSLVILAALAPHAWAARHPGLAQAARQWAGALPGRLGLTGQDPRRRGGAREPSESTLVIALILGLAVVALVAVGLGKLVDDVTDGEGIAVVDHPVASFVAGHRTPALTSVMGAASSVGGPVGMAVLALVAGLLLGAAWRSWTPVVALAVTTVGVTGLTMVFKAALGRARPPVAQAVAAADGYGFPSGHAATAAAVCAAIAWLCSLRIRSWPGRVAVQAAAAMVAALVGISRVYLGVHWTTDVIGGWSFGVLWAAVVMSGWSAFGRLSETRR